jgi:hypothetical protein
MRQHLQTARHAPRHQVSAIQGKGEVTMNIEPFWFLKTKPAPEPEPRTFTKAEVVEILDKAHREIGSPNQCSNQGNSFALAYIANQFGVADAYIVRALKVKAL